MSAPVVHHLQNRCLRRFHDAGATDAKSALLLNEIGIGDSFVFRHLRSRGVLREAEPGRYYVDAEAERSFRCRRRQFTLAVVSFSVVVVVSLLTVFLLSR
jgi:hypothetical protein